MAVALYILMLRLTIPIPLKYPTPGAFPVGGVAGTREAPSLRGLLSSLAPGKKRAPSVVSENAPHGTLP